MSESSASIREVPVDWEALEDAFENNAPEVHSYLHVVTGEVIRVVDGIADPGMHTKIASHADYLRIDPVSSREQYRWMERFIPMVEEGEVQRCLAQSIDGKGAFRRFKDVLMSFATERERWFSFRSERLRVFMEAWLLAHALRGTVRAPVVSAPVVPALLAVAVPVLSEGAASPESEVRPDDAHLNRDRPEEGLRRRLMDVIESLNAQELEKVVAFAEFVGARVGERSVDRSPEKASRAFQRETPIPGEAVFEKDPPTQRRPAERRS